MINDLENSYRFINENLDSRWVLKHPEPTFTNHLWKIPSQYLTKEKNGIMTCEIYYRFHFFSSDQNSEGDEINATHILITRSSQGNRGTITFDVKGFHVLNRQVQDPSGTPPNVKLPTRPIEPPITIGNPETFNIPMSNPNNVGGLGDPKASTETGGIHIQVVAEPPVETITEVPPVEIPIDIQIEPPVETITEVPVEPVEPTKKGDKENE